jgi:putative transposase
VQLHYWRRLHCGLYNAAVYNRKTQYQKFNHSVDYFEQQNSLPEFKEVLTEYKPFGSDALKATLKRVDFAFVRFFKGLGGYPKFKAYVANVHLIGKGRLKRPVDGRRRPIKFPNYGGK